MSSDSVTIGLSLRYTKFDNLTMPVCHPIGYACESTWILARLLPLLGYQNLQYEPLNDTQYYMLPDILERDELNIYGSRPVLMTPYRIATFNYAYPHVYFHWHIIVRNPQVEATQVDYLYMLRPLKPHTWAAILSCFGLLIFTIATMSSMTRKITQLQRIFKSLTSRRLIWFFVAGYIGLVQVIYQSKLQAATVCNKNVRFPFKSMGDLAKAIAANEYKLVTYVDQRALFELMNVTTKGIFYTLYNALGKNPPIMLTGRPDACRMIAQSSPEEKLSMVAAEEYLQLDCSHHDLSNLLSIKITTGAKASAGFVLSPQSRELKRRLDFAITSGVVYAEQVRFKRLLGSRGIRKLNHVSAFKFCKTVKPLQERLGLCRLYLIFGVVAAGWLSACVWFAAEKSCLPAPTRT